LRRLLADSDPLAARRAETMVSEELNRGPLLSAAVTAPVAVVGGALRLSPFVLDSAAGSWQGAVAYDLKTFGLDARGTLAAKASPKGWTGSPPSIGLAWRGRLANPVREIEVGALTNGLAAIVLQRELEKIEAFEADANERMRRQQRLDYERQRERDRQAAEEVARQARLREEAERARAEAERARIEAERAQAEQKARAEAERRAKAEADQRAKVEAEQRARAEAERRPAPEAPPATPLAVPALPPPIDIRPPPQIQVRPDG
jgi:hypothetical protein